MTLSEVIPNQNVNYLEEKANSILYEHKIEHHYHIDLDKIISSYKGIRVHYMNQDSKTIIKHNKAIIIVNNKKNVKIQRQELTEEFCHVLLHCGNQINYHDDIILDKQESQAKRMSAYLLCPMLILKHLNFTENTYLLIEELAEYFNVTNDFMRYRLSLIFGQDLNMITHYKGEFYGYTPIE